jgi:hypothetical protein
MPHTQFPPLNACGLCGSNEPLQQSHILPNFLIKRLRQPNGRFYAASRPQRPLQKGAVARLLCLTCEQSFSRWEQRAKETFYPDGIAARLPLRYRPWLQLFALSVSWRALVFLKHSTPNPYGGLAPAAERLLQSLPDDTHLAADEKLGRWAAALLAEEAPADQDDQHLLFLSGTNFPAEKVEIVGFTVCHTEEQTAVVSQLGQICIVGTIRDRIPGIWRGTRIQSLGGIFPVNSQRIPSSFAGWMQRYFRDLADIEP